MARTLPKPPQDRHSEQGFALILALFLLAIAGMLGMIIGGNGVSARKSARAASYRAAAQERAAVATWGAADALEQPQNSAHFLLSIGGQEVSVAISPETGRIDLNGLSTAGLSQAIVKLGYDPTTANQAAALLSDWRGTMLPDSSGLTTGLPDGRQALWSVDDVDAITGLDAGIRDCLKLWGTVHSRGAFSITSLDQPLSVASEIGGAGNIVVGSMIRVIVTDSLTGASFRSVLLYRGGVYGSGSSPWMIMEWLAHIGDSRCGVRSQG